MTTLLECDRLIIRSWIPESDAEQAFAIYSDHATEAGGAILDYSFRVLHLPVIYAVVKAENHASIRVTQRLTMKPVGLTN